VSDQGSVFSKGGGGTNFEQYVQTAFLTTMIIRGIVPGFPINKISKICFQTTRLGYQTDDFLVITNSSISENRMLIQAKYNLTFSAKNEKFNEVIHAFWTDYNNPKLFNRENDRLIIVKGGLNNEERNHIKVILDWAKSKTSSADFLKEVKRIKVKTEKLEIFSESIKDANNGNAISDEELWNFLRCVDLLEYDFSFQGSVDEANFLNLIKLSKSNGVDANEKEIWNTIFEFVAKRNKDGAELTLDSIQKETIYKYFDYEKLIPVFNSIDKLRESSKVLLLPLKNTIHGFHFERNLISETIINSINAFDFTVITGIAGAGKSAMVKDILDTDYNDASVFVFRADQFNLPHLGNVFTALGVNENLKDIFSCLSLISNKILFIDSFEKLLEGDPENAFKQFISSYKEIGNLKVIFASRKYAVQLLTQKYDLHNINEVEVSHLGEEDLQTIINNYPKLLPLCNNVKIKEILKSPKYLDFTVSLVVGRDEDYSKISFIDFKNKLWKHIVENDQIRKNGLPAKRSKAFINIAIQRAKKMSLFVSPSEVDDYAVDQLENDNIIYKHTNERLYSPSHDILEDWALVKYIKEQFDRYSTAVEFFNNIGNEPAIRRGFRLWVEDTLLENEEYVFKLVDETVNEPRIEKYWSDELLIAIFKSELSKIFFEKYSQKLLDDNAVLLDRCLRLIRTACKEGLLKGESNLSLLFPIGSGWKEAIKFTSKNLSVLDNQRLIISDVLLDWQNIIFKPSTELSEETIFVRDIIIHYVKQMEALDGFWYSEEIKKKKIDLIILLFFIAEIAKDEIQELVKRTQVFNRDRDNWELSNFYEKIIEKFLSGLYSRFLAPELPDLILEVAAQEWKIEKSKNEPKQRYNSYKRVAIEEYFGLEHRSTKDFPAGIYKTPIYYLLWSHPVKTIRFIIDFIDYATSNYVDSEFAQGDEPKEIELELNDGTTIKQWGSWVLWHMYRGTGKATPYLLQSILMSLEKFLLELAKADSEKTKHNIKIFFNYLLSQSHSVAITSVLASVTMAFPESVEDEFLPILRVHEFYDWDLTRAVQESSNFAPMDNEISFAQKERYESNKLPHRTKHLRGLRDFVVYYQFNIRSCNNEIHKILDKFISKVSQTDIRWRKALNEMDVRKYEVGEFNKDIGAYSIRAKHEDDISEYIKSGEPEYEKNNKSLSLTNWLAKISENDNEVEKDFSKWDECYNYYIIHENKNILYDRPTLLAVIGLRNYNSNLSELQKKWGINLILKSIQSLLRDTLNENYFEIPEVHPLDKEPTLRAFSLLFDNVVEKEHIIELEILLMHVIIATFFHQDLEILISNIREELFIKHPEIVQIIWLGLLNYAEFAKTNHYFIDDPDKERLQKALQKKAEFIERSIKNHSKSTPDIEKITLEKYEHWFLRRAFEIIPYRTKDQLQLDFIKVYIQLIINDQRNNDHDEFEYEAVYNASLYLSIFLLENELQNSYEVIDLLIEATRSLNTNYHYRHDSLFKFLSDTMKNIIYSLDKFIANCNDETEISNQIERFWSLWEYLFIKIKNLDGHIFVDILLLDAEWNESAVHWKPLEKKKTFYKQICEELGAGNVKHILKLLSTVGDTTFLPDGLSWIVNICKQNNDQIIYLISCSGERLIEHLFQKHLGLIKSNSVLINDFIWLLDNMIDLGSSKAYLIREYVITYKKYE
jgi:hypothetical protein